MGRETLFAACLLGSAYQADAQTPDATQPGEVAVAANNEGQESPSVGRFRLGPLYLTPYISIGSLGFDTNVFYTPTDRQSDFTISGGPGLEVVLPVKQASRLSVDSALDYQYFARTESQRRLNGSVRGAFEYAPGTFDSGYLPSAGDFRPAARFKVEESIVWSNNRYSFEADVRVPLRTEGTRAEIFKPLFGRMGIELEGWRSLARVLEPTEFNGVDLERTMTSDSYLAAAGLRHYLTIMTSLRVRAEYTYAEFPLDPTRDADSIAVRGGVETDANALIAGHVYVGHRWFRPRTGTLPERQLTEFEIDGMWAAAPRTRLGGGYRRNLEYSVLAATGTLPTLVSEAVEARIEAPIWKQLGIRLFGRRLHFVTDSAVELDTGSGLQSTPRDDIAWEGGANLGWSFGPRVRVGVEATYSERTSNFDDLGVDGLLLGLTVDVLTPLTEKLDPRRRY